MCLSNYKKHKILIWVFSLKNSRPPDSVETIFVTPRFVMTSFGHNPVLRAACYGQRVTGRTQCCNLTICPQHGGEGAERVGVRCAIEWRHARAERPTATPL